MAQKYSFWKGAKNWLFSFENFFGGSKKLSLPVQPEQPVRLDSLDVNVHNPRKLSFASRSLGVYTESCSAKYHCIRYWSGIFKKMYFLFLDCLKNKRRLHFKQGMLIFWSPGIMDGLEYIIYLLFSAPGIINGLDKDERKRASASARQNVFTEPLLFARVLPNLWFGAI